MVDNLRTNSISGLDPSLTQAGGLSKKEKNDQVDKNEFITLLVTQLKNQDPLNPMENDEFAVKLAQFSQLEQLVSINEKLDNPGSDFTSMAAYLGHEVVLNSSSVEVENGEGGGVQFQLEQDANNVKVEILSKDGNVVDTIELGALSAGKHKGTLTELTLPDGEYDIRIKAQSTTGAEFEPQVYAAGVVSGFVPGPEPVLMLGNRQISPSEIREVAIAA